MKGDGTGKHPSVADTVTLHYAGTFIDGTQFDSSYDRGAPATFPLGMLIKGWQVAVPLMGVGDTFEVAIPADLGYGFKGKGRSPAAPRCCSRSNCSPFRRPAEQGHSPRGDALAWTGHKKGRYPKVPPQFFACRRFRT